MRCVVIGLGSIGLGIAHSLREAKHDVVGVDLSEERRSAFEALGGEVSESAPDSVVSAECVFCVVVNGAQTEAVLFGDSGVAQRMPEHAVFVSCATMAPETAQSLAERLSATGRRFIDAPTSGGPGKAMEGAVTLLASGPSDAFDAVSPLLDAIAENVFRLGDEAGSGSGMKIVNQLLAGVHIATACEAMAFAIRIGLPPEQVFEVITHAAGNSWMFENRVPHILEGDYSPKSAVSIFTKDLGIVLDTARRNDFPVPMAGMGLQMFEMAAAAGFGAMDDASVAKVYATLAGLKLPEPSEPPAGDDQ